MLTVKKNGNSSAVPQWHNSLGPSADISQMPSKRRPIEGKIAGWDDIGQPNFRVLALSAAS